MPEILRRKAPDSRAAEVARVWEGETAAVIATGPSLNKDDLERIRGLRCIAVSDSYLVAPWAEVLYAADHTWWKWHIEGRKKTWPWVSFTADEVKQAMADFRGQKVTISHNQIIQDDSILVLDNAGPDGLSTKQDAICTGQNSGYQALNIAVLAGARRILLLGFDMRFHGGKSHAHNGHDAPSLEQSYINYAKNFSKMENPLKDLGVEVINCTPGSMIKAFPFSTVEQECVISAV